MTNNYINNIVRNHLFIKGKNGELSVTKQFRQIKKQKKYPNIYTYIYNLYNDFNIGAYMIYKSTNEFPVCKICGKPVTFKLWGFHEYCSRECSYKDKELKTATEIQRKKSMLECYGVDSPLKIPKVKEKRNQTNIERYGIPYPVSRKNPDDIHWTHTNEGKKTLLNRNQKLSKSKAKCLKMLCKKYNNVEANKVHDEYKFDFYISSIRTFIDLHNDYTHGYHPYNENNNDDKMKVITMSNTNYSYYKHCVKTWTITDVQKRKYVKEAKLRYKEFWSISELEDWVKEKRKLSDYV